MLLCILSNAVKITAKTAVLAAAPKAIIFIDALRLVTNAGCGENRIAGNRQAVLQLQSLMGIRLYKGKKYLHSFDFLKLFLHFKVSFCFVKQNKAAGLRPHIFVQYAKCAKIPSIKEKRPDFSRNFNENLANLFFLTSNRLRKPALCNFEFPSRKGELTNFRIINIINYVAAVLLPRRTPQSAHLHTLSFLHGRQ